MKILVLVLLILFLFPTFGMTLDRCNDFKEDVRIQHTKYFGFDFPWWFGIGQLKQESGCRANTTAWDLGQGIAQFMPATAKYINSLMGENLNPYKPEDGIKMQAYYMSIIYRGQKWSGKLWTAYQSYNGGEGNLVNEYKRANELDWNAMLSQCHRKVVTLKSGEKLDFCKVNYDYSKQIYKYGNLYNTGNPVDNWEFW